MNDPHPIALPVGPVRDDDGFILYIDEDGCVEVQSKYWLDHDGTPDAWLIKRSGDNFIHTLFNELHKALGECDDCQPLKAQLDEMHHNYTDCHD